MIVRSAPARGVAGRAELAFTRQGGRTVLARSRLDAPMAIVRPFPLSEGGLLIQLLSLGPGLCGGDRIHLDVSAGPGTRVVVTTTAATRIMSMDPGTCAEQHVVLRAGAESALEYYPCLTIPYPGSALTQSIAADAAAGSHVGIVECWAMGRTARAEYLEFRSLASRTTLSVDGVVEYADAIHLDPETTDVAGAAVLAGRHYLASGCWLGATLPADPAATAHGDIGDGDPLHVLAQSTPRVAYLRALGHDGPAVNRALGASVERVTRAWGLPAVNLDRFHN